MNSTKNRVSKRGKSLNKHQIPQRKRMSKSDWLPVTLIMLFMITFLLSIDFGNIVGRTVDKILPETEYSHEEILSFTPEYSPLWLCNMMITEDGKLELQSSEAWIYIGYRQLNLAMPLNLKIVGDENLSFLIWSVENYEVNGVNTSTGGEAFVNLGYLKKDDVGLRIDVVGEAGQVINIERLVLNDKNVSIKYICNFFRNLAVAVFFAALLFFLNSIVAKKECFLDVASLQKNRKILLSLCSVGVVCLSLYLGVWEISIIVLFFDIITKKEPRTEKCSKYGIVMRYGNYVLLTVYTVFLLTKLQADNILILTNLSDKIIFTTIFFVLFCARRQSMGAVAAIIVGYVEFYYFNILFLGNSLSGLLKSYINHPLPELNILILLLVFVSVELLFGKKLGNLIYFLTVGLYYLADIVKYKYQGTVFRLSDFRLFDELLEIIDQYISPLQIVLISLGILGIFASVIIWRKRLAKYFKPKFSGQGIYVITASTVLFISIVIGNFSPMGITAVDGMSSLAQISQYGFHVYTLFEFTGRNVPKKPEGYSADLTNQVSQYKDDTTESEESPVVILVLAESLYEIENDPNLVFNQPVLPNLQKYKAGNGISPFYGGRTVCAEFEALTGLSNYFITGEEAPYTTYMNAASSKTGSVVGEFEKNDYHTVAIHANKKSFYGRDDAFSCMGFDEFISKEEMDLRETDSLNSGYTKDAAFADYLIRAIASAEDAAFIYGASIESHGPYKDKYETTVIQAFSDVYDTDSLEEVNQYAQSISNFDSAMEKVFEYCDNCDKKVNIYIFGDHLPALSIHAENDYLKNPYLKYGVPIYSYSNYKEITIGEDYISLSKIAPQILRDAGIKYHSYFDVIYQGKQQYPVLQQEFDVNYEDESVRLLNLIQYDLLMGQQFLLQTE